MPFVRFSRDKRGYENFFLIDSDARGPGGKQEHRILYWFRTPPNVKVGRKPFDDPATRELEAKNPGVTFDWEKLRNTPIPPVQFDYWRERRRSERAAREAESDMEKPGGPEAGGMPGVPVAADAVEPVAASQVAEPAGELPEPGAQSGPPHRRRRRRRRSGGDRRQYGQVAASQFEEQADRRAVPSITSDQPIGSGESSEPHGEEEDYDEDAQSQE